MHMIPANLGQITIRYLEKNDFDAYITLEKDPYIMQHIGGVNKKSGSQIRNSLFGYKPNHTLLAIADSSTNQYIGRCGLLDTKSPQEKEIYILLKKDSQKKGFGKIIIPFLCDTTSSQGYTQTAYIDPKNIDSLNFFEKLKWVNVGTLTKSNYQDGHLIYVPPMHEL